MTVVAQHVTAATAAVLAVTRGEDSELDYGAILNCVRGIIQPRVDLQLLVSETEARELGYGGSVATTGTASHKWWVSDGQFKVATRCLPESTAALMGTGKFGTLSAVISRPTSAPEILIEDVEINHVAGAADRLLLDPQPFFRLPPVHTVIQQPVLHHFTGIPGADSEYQYVKPYSCRGECHSCSVHLGGSDDGLAMVQTIGCVAAVRGCPRFEHSGVYDAPRKDTQALELPSDGSQPTNRVKRYALCVLCTKV
jgi:hypothetical protein